MRAAVTITKIFELEEDTDIKGLEIKFQEHHNPRTGEIYQPEIDWYDIDECQEIWSFAILD